MLRAVLGIVSCQHTSCWPVLQGPTPMPPLPGSLLTFQSLLNPKWTFLSLPVPVMTLHYCTAHSTLYKSHLLAYVSTAGYSLAVTVTLKLWWPVAGRQCVSLHIGAWEQRVMDKTTTSLSKSHIGPASKLPWELECPEHVPCVRSGAKQFVCPLTQSSQQIHTVGYWACVLQMWRLGI
jgi:hypothetical protein